MLVQTRSAMGGSGRKEGRKGREQITDNHRQSLLPPTHSTYLRIIPCMHGGGTGYVMEGSKRSTKWQKGAFLVPPPLLSPASLDPPKCQLGEHQRNGSYAAARRRAGIAKYGPPSPSSAPSPVPSSPTSRPIAHRQSVYMHTSQSAQKK